MLPTQPIIGTLRVRTRRRDEAALRLDVERQLAASALTARHLAPAAILLIRKLDDPLPRRLREPEWQQALQTRIDALCAAATRPALGRIDARSDALLFVDEAEMLACLALDLASAGDPASWWRRAVARFLRHANLRALLAGQPRLLPAAFSQLEQWQSLARVVGALTHDEALALCDEFAAANELRAVLRAVETCRRILGASDAEPAPPVTGSFSLSSVDRSDLSEPAPHTPNDASPASPGTGTRIDTWIPSGCRSLGIAQQLLIAAVLGFRAAPTQLAAPRVAFEFRRWLIANTRPRASPGATDPPMRVAESPRAAGIELPTPDAGVQIPISTPAVDTVTRAAALEPNEPEPPPSAAQDEAPAEAEPDARLDGLETGLGGLLYLINVMGHLELPGSFESSCGLASSTGFAGTLEALARVLAGLRGDELAHDPIWAILAGLDGREPNEPPRAAGLRLPDKLPAAWLEQLGDGTPVPRDSDRLAIEALRRAGWPPALLDWLQLVMPFIGWRIARACGLDSVDEAVRLLIELPARVYVTASHVDVVTSIENIRVPVRLAGLDRSPGWVRSLQRVVLFHFE